MMSASLRSWNKVVFTLIVVPFVLLIVSLLQLYYVPTVEQRLAEVAVLDTQLAKLQVMTKERNYWLKSVELADGERYMVPRAIKKLEAERGKILQRSTFVGATLPATLAAIGAFSSIFVVLVSIIGLAYIYRMSRQAMMSRQLLLQTFDRGHRLLLWIVVLSLLGMACAFICVSTYELLIVFWPKAQDGGSMKGFLFFALMLPLFSVAAFYLIFKLIKTTRQTFALQPITIMGSMVTLTEAPKVWEFVKDVAQSMGATMPTHIVIGLNEGFFVTEGALHLTSGLKVPSGRILHLSLPYMAFLEQAEVRAIIGHELAHFVGEDIEYSLKFSPIYASVQNQLTALGTLEGGRKWSNITKPALDLASLFLQVFDESVQHWSRQRELAADRVGATCSSSEAMVLALLRISALAPRIAQALDECWQHGDKIGVGVLARIRELVQTMGLENVSTHLDGLQTHPTDTHPTMRQRIDALGYTITKELLAHAQAPIESELLYELALEDTPTQPTNTVRAAMSQVLESEFKVMADTKRQEQIEFLTQRAQKGQQTQTIHEGNDVNIIALGFVSAVAFDSALREGLSGSAVIGSSFAVVGFAFVWLIVRILRKRRIPLLILNDIGIQFANLTQPLPWTSICAMNQKIIYKAGIIPLITVTFDIAEEAQHITFSGDSRIKLNQEKNVVVTLQGIRKMSQKSFIDRLYEYWHGGIARVELANLHKRL